MWIPPVKKSKGLRSEFQFAYHNARFTKRTTQLAIEPHLDPSGVPKRQQKPLTGLPLHNLSRLQ